MEEQRIEDVAVEGGVNKFVPWVRFIFVLPIMSALVASFVLVVFGFAETFRVIVEVLSHPNGHAMTTLRLHFVEVIDTFLLATILFVIGIGFYQLFVSPNLKVAAWMKVDSVHDLEVMLLGVVVTLLSVAGLAAIMSWDGQTDLMPFGVTIGLIIAALAYFMGRSTH